MQPKHRLVRGENNMAYDRITPCKHYLCKGKCSKGREANHTGYCQKCNKYEPRCKVKRINRKKEKIEKIKKKEFML